MPLTNSCSSPHQGLMVARAGDTNHGVKIARAALDDLPPEKHSLTLRMLMNEVSDTKQGPKRRV